VKWIRLFALGVITVGVAMVLLVLLGGEVDLTWVSTLVRVLLGLGGLAIIVGLTGLIVGGRRSVPEQEAPKA
jgi:Na+(H+)/acetate symporter ActP